MTDDTHGKIITGWREYVALPDWRVGGVLTKVDTGARTSALHVKQIIDLPNDRVRFDVVLSRTNPDRTVTVEADLARIAVVKPSSGKKQTRRIVRTKMKLGPIEKEIDISLVCRQAMLCRMLLGRLAIEPELIVDPAKCYMFGKPKRIRKKKR